METAVAEAYADLESLEFPPESPGDSNPSPGILIEEGDRVQVLDKSYRGDGIIDRWLMVQKISGLFITATNGNGLTVTSPFSRVIAHRKSSSSHSNISTQDSIVYIRRVLFLLVYCGAPSMVLDFWESKLVHAERLREDEMKAERKELLGGVVVTVE